MIFSYLFIPHAQVSAIIRFSNFKTLEFHVKEELRGLLLAGFWFGVTLRSFLD